MRVFGWLAGVFGLCGLTACADLTGFGGGPQVTRLALFDGSVSAAGPAGYCVAPAASRPGQGFAVLASCAVIADPTAATGPNGFVTVQMGAAGSGLGADVDALPGLLRTEPGRRLLSQTSNADSVRVQSSALGAGGATVRFLDLAAPPVTGLQQTEWRGFLDIKGRSATVSVRGLDTAPLGTDDGQALLERVMIALQQANPPVRGP